VDEQSSNPILDKEHPEHRLDNDFLAVQLAIDHNSLHSDQELQTLLVPDQSIPKQLERLDVSHSLALLLN
jgi:hypothetical protein